MPIRTEDGGETRPDASVSRERHAERAGGPTSPSRRPSSARDDRDTLRGSGESLEWSGCFREGLHLFQWPAGREKGPSTSHDGPSSSMKALRLTETPIFASIGPLFRIAGPLERRRPSIEGRGLLDEQNGPSGRSAAPWRRRRTPDDRGGQFSTKTGLRRGTRTIHEPRRDVFRSERTPPSEKTRCVLQPCGRAAKRARVAKLADAADLGSAVATREGSSPSPCTDRRGPRQAGPA